MKKEADAENEIEETLPDDLDETEGISTEIETGADELPPDEPNAENDTDSAEPQDNPDAENDSGSAKPQAEDPSESKAKETAQERGTPNFVSFGIGMLFLLTGLFFCYIFTVKPILQCRASRDWVQTPATILSSRLAEKRSGEVEGEDSSRLRGKNVFQVQIIYRYSFDGKRRQSDCYDFFISQTWGNSGVSDMKRIVQEYPAGKNVTCYVNPREPDESVIYRSLPRQYFYIAWLPLAFLGCGILVLVKSRGKRK